MTDLWGNISNNFPVEDIKHGTNGKSNIECNESATWQIAGPKQNNMSNLWIFLNINTFSISAIFYGQNDQMRKTQICDNENKYEIVEIDEIYSTITKMLINEPDSIANS